MQSEPTIIAIGSPPGRSLRGIVRISGVATFTLLNSIIQKVESTALAPGRVHRIRLNLGDHAIPALLIAFLAPRSYTGEDAAELQVPGNPTVLDRVLASLIAAGRTSNLNVRLAEPGEFTARAFLNQRMTLTQAEGVAATIAAQSDAELRAARMLLAGTLGTFAQQLADDLSAALALVEAGIDFTDQDDVVAIAPIELLRRLRALQQQVKGHLVHAVGIEQLQAIPWVVLVGEPNAGKSALFNALLGRERAIVSAISGTTRDVLAEPLVLTTSHGPAEVMLVDLAGFDDESSLLNQSMQAIASQALSRAELVLRCVPIDQQPPMTLQDELVVRTKCDLKPETSHSSAIHTSAYCKKGLDTLKNAITERLADRAVSLAADAIALRPRHETALRSALRGIEDAVHLVETQGAARGLSNPELVAAAMRSALDDLSALAGEITPDDVLGRIFASFCIGK